MQGLFGWLSALGKKFSLKHEETASFSRQQEYKELASLKPLTALHQFNTDLEGLDEEEAEKRLKHDGKNHVYEEKKESLWSVFFSYFSNPFIALLCVLDIVSLITKDWGGVIVISVMIALSILLTYFQERRSTKAVKKLQSLVSNLIFVVRKEEQEDEDSDKPRYVSKKYEIPFHDLVVGDIIHLSAGDMIPADCKIISAKDLFISQSALTGEALPVEKFANIDITEDFSLVNARNLCFMGSSVISGSAIALIISTGKNTYYGAIAKNLTREKPKTNFDKSLERYAWLVIKFMLVLLPLVFLINGFFKDDWLSAFFFALAVTVGLTSEMLPMVVAVNLSRGAIAMSKRKVVMKKLNAIQNFGAMDILCTDKTGTLTQDTVVLEKYVDIEGEESSLVLLYTYLNSFYQTGLNSLMDRAVLAHKDELEKYKIAENYRKIDEVPFDFARRRMSVVVENKENEKILICKGALEEILSLSKFYTHQDQLLELSLEKKQEMTAMVQAMNLDGLRVIAVGLKLLAKEDWQYTVEDESDLILTGFVAFLDPPKESAKEAISQLHALGITVKVLTGDNEFVSRKICKQVGIEADKILLGSDIEPLNDVELAAKVEGIYVFAKLSPFQKERVISALHYNNHVVGFLGDGINDAPAMKRADIGISVENAVDIAKETADVILLEKSLLVLMDGVKEGRKVYGKIINFIKIGASSNFGNVFTIVGSSLLLPFLPMLPAQIMLGKIIYDFSQTAIPWDNVDPEFIERPHKWELQEVKRFMLVFGPYSSIFDYLTFAVLWYVYHYTTLADQSLFSTAWFIESVITQTLVYWVLRTRKIPFFQSYPSKIVFFSSIAGIVVAVYIPNSFFGHFFGFSTLPYSFYLWLTAICASYILFSQVLKKVYYKFFSIGKF